MPLIHKVALLAVTRLHCWLITCGIWIEGPSAHNCQAVAPNTCSCSTAPSALVQDHTSPCPPCRHYYWPLLIDRMPRRSAGHNHSSMLVTTKEWGIPNLGISPQAAAPATTQLTAHLADNSSLGIHSNATSGTNSNNAISLQHGSKLTVLGPGTSTQQQLAACPTPPNQVLT